MMKSMNLFMMIFISMSFINILINSMPSLNKMLHPIIMSLMLLLFSMFTSMNLSIYFNNQWISFITFLIIIGGLMILFLYFNSFISNMMISLNLNSFKKTLIKCIYMIMIFLLLITYLKKYLIWYNNFNEIKTLKDLISLNELKIKNNMIFLFIYNLKFNIMISILYLLTSLTLIVKMILINKFTLRKINYEKIFI
uniref:NADH dehydrogenase subunit 6 n=1 Tax=Leptomastidea bifasciata TaxID=1880993 RepID=UPI002E794E17|nr:NADH dehydrogenase subunit 6 [Leptomastidea bifasciata]WPT46963.1 NADH dehydrogenase subunit 6 [Leptomastidea bifasciata]